VAMDDGRRVYIHHSVFGGGDLQVGQRLKVMTKPDARNPGKWCVANVRTDTLEAGRANQGPPLLAATVVEWDLRGYGFVQTDDARRIYVHHSAFGSGNLNLGERVSVAAIPDQRNPGKLMAHHLERDDGMASQGGDQWPTPDQAAPFSLASGPGPCSQGPSQGPSSQDGEDWLPGTVAEWHEERGYGFIVLEDGRRLYVHHSAFGGGSLQQGSPCEATAAPDKVNHGKWSATAVRGAAVVQRTGGGGEPASKRHRAA